jgi:L-ascorbate metabolism protein UlaG (beta-lactamase superfamily)
MTVTITLIGGPTALIEVDGFRLLTDPTFDEPGAYQLPHVKLEKLSGPAMSARDVGAIDAVLLSHDQHSDNLDHSGRDFLREAKRVLTTEAGAKRLGGKTEGFAPWASTELKKGGQSLTITATPARHGPAGIEPLSGYVIGFVVESSRAGSRPIYISGDTTWFDGVAEVAKRFKCGVVLPFAGAAQTRGPFHLTMDTNDTIETARAFADAVIVPVHTDGWAHFRQAPTTCAPPSTRWVSDRDCGFWSRAWRPPSSRRPRNDRFPCQELAPSNFVIAAAWTRRHRIRSIAARRALRARGRRRKPKHLGRFASAMRSRRSAPA